ncbi:hypothetical protein EDB81DRAFT_457301 [Dactylonectria macrodidyma]|nr:hypothetical protein EDB81DRAFT_457301 [Dactylonectria macrodidyma]
MPEPKPKSTFVDAIAECGDKLEAAGLPRESVKFMIGQVGSNTAATKFLQDIGKELRIANVVFVASGSWQCPPTCISLRHCTTSANNATEKLDVTSSRLESDWKTDEWLIETLYAPITRSEGKKKQ